jgi:hypothetical protein
LFLDRSHWLKGGWHDWTGPKSVLERDLILSRDGNRAIRVEDIEDVGLPLYEGRMVGQFDFSQKGWVSGKGRTAVWREIPWNEKVIEPQFIIGLKDQDAVYLKKYLDRFKERFGNEAAEQEEDRLRDGEQWEAWRASCRRKVGFMDITSATNERTMIGTGLDDGPCGNSAPVLYTRTSVAGLVTVLGTFSTLAMLWPWGRRSAGWSRQARFAGSAKDSMTCPASIR